MQKVVNFKVDTYRLDLKPSDDEAIFFGVLVISGHKIGRPSKRITLSQKNLKVNSAEIVHNDKKGHSIHELLRINHLKTFSEVRLHTPTMLYPGHYTLTLHYSGKINEKTVAEEVIKKFGEYNFSRLEELDLIECGPSEIMPCIEQEKK